MPPAFLELSAVLVLATALGIVAKLFKQPLIVAYIFAGLIISFLGFFKQVDKSVFELFSDLGIAFLLFLVGVELKVDDLKSVGKASVLTGLGQIAFTTVVGFVLIAALGFSTVAALYMAFAVTFSSTVIIIKLLSEKNALHSLHGKISVGFLIVQDLVAILFLMIMSGIKANSVSPVTFLIIFIKGAVLVAAAYLISKYVLKHLFKMASTSGELLFVSAISWAFAMAAMAAILGFSTAIGAFLAGLSIASSKYSLQISARIKPMRDFFIVIFFILLGASIAMGASGVKVSHVLILSLFILIGEPLIMFAIMISLKFRNRTSFLTAVTTAQVSEFSLILMTFGLSQGVVSSQMVSLVSAVAIVTIMLSSYLILYGDHIFTYMEKPVLKFFPERKHEPFVLNREELKDHVIVVGAEQMGWDILEFIRTKVKDLDQVLVVDFNPSIIRTLRASGYNAVFGDISDPEVLEELEINKARLVVLTDVDSADSERFIKFAKAKNYKGPIMAASYWIHDAIKLYEMGADYVVVPETVGGKHVARVLSDHWDDLEAIKKAKSKHFEELMAKKVF